MEKKKIYLVNKAIGRPMEFRGLKAQYIGRLAGYMVGIMVGFAGLHIAGLNPFINMLSALGLGGIVVTRLFRMSRNFGQYGLMKRAARRGLPKALVSRSRRVFLNLFSDGTGKF